MATARLTDVVTHLLAEHTTHPPSTSAITESRTKKGSGQLPAKEYEPKEPAMTMATSGPVICGPPHTVVEVDGRPPTGLAGCVGERTLTLVRSGLAYLVHGTGTDRADGAIRFHQKDLGPGGKDVRVWKITHPGDDVLLARHCSTAEPSVGS
jgi:hypothetical protein